LAALKKIYLKVFRSVHIPEVTYFCKRTLHLAIPVSSPAIHLGHVVLAKPTYWVSSFLSASRLGYLFNKQLVMPVDSISMSSNTLNISNMDTGSSLMALSLSTMTLCHNIDSKSSSDL